VPQGFTRLGVESQQVVGGVAREQHLAGRAQNSGVSAAAFPLVAPADFAGLAAIPVMAGSLATTLFGLPCCSERVRAARELTLRLWRRGAGRTGGEPCFRYGGRRSYRACQRTARRVERGRARLARRADPRAMGSYARLHSLPGVLCKFSHV
jgi:hypothetical protein